MVKQYIGARYVPVFDGEYNAEKAYEPLTIVTYLNSSYTSKKTVPAGTLPTNTEFWALTGNYNAQVEQYRQEVEAYAERVTALEKLKAFITPQVFGAVGDGVHDDTAAINDTIEYAYDHGIAVVIPNGTYKVSFSEETYDNQHVAIMMKSNTTLILLNSVITSDGNDLTHYTYIECNTVENVEIVGFNARIEGERNSHTGSTGEWGYGVQIIKSSDVKVSGLQINNCWGDGIAIDCINSNITISDIVGDGNGRNGISVTGGNHIIIEKCRMSGSDRTLPKASIDLEPFDNYSIDDVVIRDCDLKGNDTYSLLVGSAAVSNVVVDHCDMDKLCRTVDNVGKITYKNCNFNTVLIGSKEAIFDTCSFNGTDRTYFGAVETETLFVNCNFHSTRLDTHNTTSGSVTVDKCIFEDDTGDLNLFGNYITHVTNCRFIGTSEHRRLSNVQELRNCYVNGNIANVINIINNEILGNIKLVGATDVFIIGNVITSPNYSDFNNCSRVTISDNVFTNNDYAVRFLDGGRDFAIFNNVCRQISRYSYSFAFISEYAFSDIRAAYNKCDYRIYIGSDVTNYYVVDDKGVVQQG